MKLRITGFPEVEVVPVDAVEFEFEFEVDPDVPEPEVRADEPVVGPPLDDVLVPADVVVPLFVALLEPAFFVVLAFPVAAGVVPEPPPAPPAPPLAAPPPP